MTEGIIFRRIFNAGIPFQTNLDALRGWIYYRWIYKAGSTVLVLLLGFNVYLLSHLGWNPVQKLTSG